MAGGCDLHTWLNDWIFPAEAKLDDRAVRAGADLALAELIAGGSPPLPTCTCTPPAIAQAVLAAGISANLSCGGVYFGAPGDFSPAACPDCDHQRQLTEEFHGAGNGQILVDASIHGGVHLQRPPCGSGWPTMPSARAWGCTSTSPRDPVRARGEPHPLGPDPLPHPGPLRGVGHPGHRRPLRLDHRGRLGRHGGEGGACVHNPVSNLKLGSGVAWIPRHEGRRGAHRPGHRRGVLQQQPGHV